MKVQQHSLFLSFNMKSKQQECFLCQTPCENICAHCQLVFFCSEDHYKLHRVTVIEDGQEKSICLPFKTENRIGIGRVLVATRTIKPMELILIDPGTVIGPNYTSKPICLECLQPVNGSYYCPRCEYPMCDENCSLGSNHAKECEILSKCKFPDRPANLRIDKNNFYNETNAYAIITPLRLLLLKESNGDEWLRTNQLMDHHEDRIKNTEDWMWYEKHIVTYLLHNLQLSDRFTSAQIQRCIGLINVNAVALKFPMLKSSTTPSLTTADGKGLYPIFAIASHYCICNARYTLDPKSKNMYLRSRAMIRLGEEISVQYLSALYGNFKRRKKIREEWYFDCTCRRCSDSTERGTFISAITCPNCILGCIVPVQSLDYNSIWACRILEGGEKGCGHEMSKETIEALVDEIEEELNDINTSGEFSLYSDFIKRYSDTYLHRNHYLLMTAARNLIQWYTYKNGDPDITILREKQKLCKQLDFVLSRIDPGYSEIRSFIQKELHFSTLILNQMDMESGITDTITYSEVYRISMKGLNELERQRNQVKFNCTLGS